MFLNAQSQMRLFSVYELLRTWRERAKNVQKWAANGDKGFHHLNRAAFAKVLRRIKSDTAILQTVKDDLARTHVLFGELEFLRVALAKHEMSSRPKLMAYAPGYARIDMWTGSMRYELSIGHMVLGEATRRSIADGLRALTTDRTILTPESLAEIDAYMKLSPDAHPFDPRTESSP